MESDRHRTLSALHAHLMEISALLASDLEGILHPAADANGRILRHDHLIACMDRVRRTAERLSSLAVTQPEFGEELNVDMTRLRSATDILIPMLEQAATIAKTLPGTVEDFFILLGPAMPALERARDNVLQLLGMIDSRLAR